MDTRFWGPSGWQLMHILTFLRGHTERKQRFFRAMPDVLPCKFCRESTKQFVQDLPMGTNLAIWLYTLHARVNEKLEAQHAEDPTVERPQPTPSFPEVIQRYRDLVRTLPHATQPIGRDFLLSIAYNYDPETHDASAHRTFWEELIQIYPTPASVRKQLEPPDLSSQSTYLRSVYTLLTKLGDMPSFRSISQRLAYYKSGCASKRYKGKTCRKLPSGGYTKQRDRKRTYRIAHQDLLKNGTK
jgi:hypothetical protein